MIIVLDGLDQSDAGSCLAFIFGEYYNFMLYFTSIITLCFILRFFCHCLGLIRTKMTCPSHKTALHSSVIPEWW